MFSRCSLVRRRPVAGCGAKWTDTADRVEASYRHIEALVLMPFVRTNVGRQLRRTAGEHHIPWVACPGRSRRAILTVDTRLRLGGEAGKSVWWCARVAGGSTPDRAHWVAGELIQHFGWSRRFADSKSRTFSSG